MFKTITTILLVACTYIIQAQNSFHDRSFWKTNPTVSDVENKIKEGSDVKQLNRWGFDAVTYALLENVNDETMVHLLSKDGNDVNKLTHDGRTYIFWAAYKNNVNIVKYLLDKGAKTDVIDDKGYSIMNFMAVAGVDNTELYDLFIEKGGNILDKTPKGANALLLFIPNAKDFNKASYFIDKGLKLESRDKKGNGVIEYTAQKGNQEMLDILIKKGLEYKKTTSNNDNAMLFATLPARKGYNTLTFFRYLEGLGVEPNITNKQGQTPLHNLAYRNKDIESFNFFMEHGVDVNQVNEEGNTALMIAAKRNELNVIEKLLSRTENINLSNSKGYTALTLGLGNTLGVVKLLIDKGAKTDIIDSDGQYLGYHLFKTYNSTKEKAFYDKLELLEKHGLKIGHNRKNTNTLYHLAAEKQDVRMLEIIAKYNLDINAKNKAGLTALQQAVMTCTNLDIVKALIRMGADMKVKTEFGESLYDLAKENEALKDIDISLLK